MSTHAGSASAKSELNLPPVDLEKLLEIPSPALIYFADRIQDNIQQMISMTGDANRLRPHCKTHKSADIVAMLLASGIKHHKAATISEVEMLAMAKVPDVVLAYCAVGPTVTRVANLMQQYPNTKVTVTVDHQASLNHLSKVMADRDLEVGVLLDLNVGQNRTGIDVTSPDAIKLYQLMHQLPGIRPAGFQAYDGHVRESDFATRTAQVSSSFEQVLELKANCEAKMLPVHEVLCGGTPTFPIYAAMTQPEIRCSPGTCVLHDSGYGTAFPDLPFKPAAGVLTRIVSRPAANLITLDLGNKAIAADPPMERRAHFPEILDAKIIGHNEEHMVLQSDSCGKFELGQLLLAIPGHVCPTSALYPTALVMKNGCITDHWQITARNRKINL
ncbi:MAG: D-TA family PLP-dependent enzyme [Fuerstiella sp.]